MLPATASAAPLASDNVSLVTKLPEAVGAASARFSPDGKTMYVSTWKGLHTYDITKPEDPQRLGFLPLPHFENEDVDAGDGVVIISNDPSEGVGIIYVIDVSDPALPTIRSTIENGDIVGTGALGESNTGHIANCLQGCKYLWTTGTGEGIAIFDLTDLDNPKFVKTMEMPRASTPRASSRRPGLHPRRLRRPRGHRLGDGRGRDLRLHDGGPGRTRSSSTAPTRPSSTPATSGPSSPETAQDYPLDFLHHNSIRTAHPARAEPVVAPGADPAPVTPGRVGAGHDAAPAPRRPRARSRRGKQPAPSREVQARAAQVRRSARRCRKKARRAYKRKLKRYPPR